jgi:hypothetical protein
LREARVVLQRTQHAESGVFLHRGHGRGVDYGELGKLSP